MAGRGGTAPIKSGPNNTLPPSPQLSMEKPLSSPLSNQNVLGPLFCNFFFIFPGPPFWG